MCVTLLGILMISKLAHPLNAKLPIAIKLVDNVIDCKYEHPSKALVSMCVTVSGIITLVKFEQFLNAELPIVFKYAGKTNSVTLTWFSNAYSPISVTFLPFKYVGITN